MILVLLSLSFFDQCVNLPGWLGAVSVKLLLFFPTSIFVLLEELGSKS